jgi:hypothetical protein
LSLSTTRCSCSPLARRHSRHQPPGQPACSPEGHLTVNGSSTLAGHCRGRRRPGRGGGGRQPRSRLWGLGRVVAADVGVRMVAWLPTWGVRMVACLVLSEPTVALPTGRRPRELPGGIPGLLQAPARSQITQVGQSGAHGSMMEPRQVAGSAWGLQCSPRVLCRRA